MHSSWLKQYHYYPTWHHLAKQTLEEELKNVEVMMMMRSQFFYNGIIRPHWLLNFVIQHRLEG